MVPSMLFRAAPPRIAVSPPANAPTDMAGVNNILARGNTPIGFARGPGIANWDMALYKTIRLYKGNGPSSIPC